MNRSQVIARFNERFPENDQHAVWDWANVLTEGDTVLVPLNYVDDCCNSFARSLGIEP